MYSNGQTLCNMAVRMGRAHSNGHFHGTVRYITIKTASFLKTIAICRTGSTPFTPFPVPSRRSGEVVQVVNEVSFHMVTVSVVYRASCYCEYIIAHGR